MDKAADKKNAIITAIFAYAIALVFIFGELGAFRLGLFGEGIQIYLVDSLFRLVFGIIGTFVLYKIYKERLKSLYTAKIPKATWLWLIPIYAYFLSYLLDIPLVESVTTEYALGFAAACLQQITTGFYEETLFRGIIISAFEKHFSEKKWRISAVLTSGIIFGMGHLFNFLFGSGNFGDGLVTVLFTTCWGMFVAAIYMVTGNLLFVMILHAIWDIVVRIPNYFTNIVANAGELGSYGEIVRTIIDPVILAVVAIVICIIYKPKEK